MKKQIYFLVSLFALIGFSMNVKGQGYAKIATINSTQNYWVNSSTGATMDATGHSGNTYQWAVYEGTGAPGADYTAPGWTATTATGKYSIESGATTFKSSIKWLATGYYVVEVVETGGTCNTVRRFGVHIIDLDLLVVTKDNSGSTITTAKTECNTNSGGIYGNDDADNINLTSVTPVMGTMSATYEVTLFTAKGGATGTEIGSALPTAGWKFTVVDASTIPSSSTTSATVTWTVTGGSGTYTTGGSNVITVAPGTSVVTIKAVIQNIASASTDDYVLKFSINPTTVLVENGGASSTDYAEGQEPTTYNGTTDTASHKNDAVQITVHPVPNTSKISTN